MADYYEVIGAYEAITFDDDDPNEHIEVTEEQYEFALFIAKMDSEGGHESLINYGGHKEYPDSMKKEAIALEVALDKLEAAFRKEMERLDVIY